MALTRVEAEDFNLSATLDSGQIFSYTKKDDDIFEGPIEQSNVQISYKDGIIHVQSLDVKIKKSTIIHFFDLDHDLIPLYKLLRKEKTLMASYKAFKGLRLLRQREWEVIAGFILSSNNNVKRIQKIWNELKKINLNPNTQFPHYQLIANTSESKLRKIGLGYRAPYLLNTAKALSSNEDYFELIHQLRYQEAKHELVKLSGVGPKVADCILLYGFHKYEAFPIDVWIERMMRVLFFKNRKIKPDQIQQFAIDRWGQWAGYVQQYIFHGGRMGLLDSK